MNEKPRKRRDPSPEGYSGEKSKRFTDPQKKNIAKEYKRQLSRGKSSNEIVPDLARKYSRDERTIWGYIQRGRALITQEKTKAYRKELAWQQHYDDLRACGNKILQNARILMAYRNFQVEETRNVIDGGAINALQEEFEDQLELINEYSAISLLMHFKQKYPVIRIGGLSDWTWENVTNETISIDLITGLEVILGEPFEQCPQCLVCEHICKIR